MNKRITLTLVLIMNLAWVLAQTSGTFGALTWSYADKQLTISGQGKMINASAPADIPWKEYRDEIEKIVVEPGVTTIGDYAFFDCWKATECSLPEGITDIFKCAFYGCDNLKSCKIPSTVCVIDAAAFARCYAITSVEIPRNVKAIGTGAFESCGSLESVTLNKGLTQICPDAFASCVKLKDIQFPSTLRLIDFRAFQYCGALTEIEIPGKVETIGSSAFYECTSLAKVTLNEGLESIENAAFMNCVSLRAITIPASVQKIDNSAFANCKMLTAINVAEGNQQYTTKEGVLYESNTHTLLAYPAAKPDKTFEMPDFATAIAAQAFYGNESLTSVKLHENVQSIGGHAFAYVANLRSIDIPAATTDIGRAPFFSCQSLEWISVHKDNPKYWAGGGVLYTNGMDTLIQYPAGKKDAKYIAPSELKVVYAFSAWANKHLQAVDFPKGLTDIMYMAFAFCENLNEVTVRAADPADIALGNGLFARNASTPDRTLYVPAGSKEKYAACSDWTDYFKEIVELTTDAIENATADPTLRPDTQRVYSRDGVLLPGTLQQQPKGIYIVDGKKVVKP